MNAALGSREHSGWAALVAVGLDDGRPRVLFSRRIVTYDSNMPREAFHAAAGMRLEEAEPFLEAVRESAADTACKAIERALRELKTTGHEPVAAGVPLGRPMPSSLKTILRSHPMMHGAEGDLYREALAEAAARCGLHVVRVGSKTVVAELGEAFGLEPGAVATQLTALGSEIGPPWTSDQKEATAAAWLALVGVTARGTA